MIDPSIVGMGGHNYQYCLSVLKKSRQQGYRPLLALNRQFKLQKKEDLQIFPLYRYGVWFHNTYPLLYRYLERFLPSSNPQNSPTQNRKKACSKILSPLLLLGKRLYHYWAIRAFEQDTFRLFRKISLQKGDQIFLPNTSIVELQGFFRFFQRQPRAQKASWHLLFRRDPWETSAQNPKALKKVLKQFKANFSFFKIFFYTDTEGLTEQYEDLDIYPFQTLPIPHTYLIQEDCCSPEKLLQISYLGDARWEKGYHHLPFIVGQMEDWQEKCFFVFQSNFSLPQGDTPSRMAREILQKYPRPKVQLLWAPLSPEDYQKHLLSSHIILLPYDPKAYSLRSSGIFVEALCSAIPVVVPENTWMARELRKTCQTSMIPGAIYSKIEEVPCLIKQMIQQYSAYKKAALAWGREYTDYHNSRSLLARLEDLSKMVP